MAATRTMVDRTASRFGLSSETAAADTAYGSGGMLAWLTQRGIDRISLCLIAQARPMECSPVGTLPMIETHPNRNSRPTVDQDQPPDKHMEEREAEKTADLEALADALAAFRQLHRELDQWERVHLARGLAAVFSGSYGAGAIEAALALTPEIERSPKAKLPTDPFYEWLDLAIFERALNEIWAEPARRFPHFVPYQGAMSEQPAPFFLIVADYDQGFFCVEGPMTDDRPWNDAARHARNQSAAHCVRPSRPGSKRTRHRIPARRKTCRRSAGQHLEATPMSEQLPPSSTEPRSSVTLARMSCRR